MDVYKTEEEQVQAIKTWWKENSVSIIAGIVIGASILGGYRYWNTFQQDQSQQASAIYSTILASKADDKSKNTELLKSEYSSTPYAALAVLLLAKDELSKNNFANTISQLKWVVENSHDDGIRHIATLRLARVYLDQNEIDSAEKLVKGVKAQGFVASYSEVRGDINLAKNLITQARENYRIALSSMKQSDQRYGLVKMKLDDLTQVLNQSEVESKTK